MVTLSDEDAVSEWKIKWDFIKYGLALTLFAMHIHHVSPFAFKSPSFWFVCFFSFFNWCLAPISVWRCSVFSAL